MKLKLEDWGGGGSAVEPCLSSEEAKHPLGASNTFHLLLFQYFSPSKNGHEVETIRVHEENESEPLYTSQSGRHISRDN